MNGIILLGGRGGLGASATTTDSVSGFLCGWSKVALGGSTWADPVFLAPLPTPFDNATLGELGGGRTSFALRFAWISCLTSSKTITSGAMVGAAF